MLSLHKRQHLLFRYRILYQRLYTLKPDTPQSLPPLLTEEIFGRKRYFYPSSSNHSLSSKFQNRGGFLLQSLRSMFMPIQYPTSVHSCYARFHVYQALETYIAAIVGVMCSQAMLEALGATSLEATAGAVAIQWVMKDGIAEIGKLLFIQRYAASFDSHPKTWKAIGEVLSTVGSGLMLCTILVGPEKFLWLAATGNIFKSTSWALWGATHMCFIRNFALVDNVGDLTAKAEAQGALAQILGERQLILINGKGGSLVSGYYRLVTRLARSFQYSLLWPHCITLQREVFFKVKYFVLCDGFTFSGSIRNFKCK